MGAQGQLPRALGVRGEEQLPFGKRNGAAPLPQAQKLLQGLPAQCVQHRDSAGNTLFRHGHTLHPERRAPRLFQLLLAPLPGQQRKALPQGRGGNGPMAFPIPRGEAQLRPLHF